MNCTKLEKEIENKQKFCKYRGQFIACITENLQQKVNNKKKKNDRMHCIFRDSVLLKD